MAVSIERSSNGVEHLVSKYLVVSMKVSGLRQNNAQTGIWPTPVGPNVQLTILKLAVGAAGPTTGPSFSIPEV